MDKPTTNEPADAQIREEIYESLDEIIREGARRMLIAA